MLRGMDRAVTWPLTTVVALAAVAALAAPAAAQSPEVGQPWPYVRGYAASSTFELAGRPR